MAQPHNSSDQKMMALLMFLLSLLSLVAFLVFLLPVVIPFLESILPFDLFYSLLNFSESFTKTVSGTIPFDIGAKLVCSVIAGIFFLLFFLFNSRRQYYSNRSAYAGSTAYREIKATPKTPVKPAPAQTGSQTSNIALSGETNREDLVKLFADTKRKLDTMGKDLAFLSIDVADSTGMKVGEEKASVEHDFREYKHIVEKAINTHGAIKSAWTPDGVMICFPTVEGAINTAQDIIKGLKDFNANVKIIKKDFTIRCGVNFGRVYCDDATPMEEMSDRVIDVTGHMQKYALPDSIFIDKSLVWSLEDRSGFSPADTEVDGYDVFVWKEEG